MDRETLLDNFEVEVALLVDLAGETTQPLRSVAPACAPMTVEDLFGHLGRIYTGVRSWVLDGRRPDDWPVPATAASVDWMTAAAHELISVLLPRQARSKCATWCATDRTAGFWFRRMAHETAVHRVDVAQALGAIWNVDDELGTDGIDEAIELWLGTRTGTAVNGSGKTVRLTTDTHHWFLRPLSETVDFPTGGPADATVSGDTAAVWAWVWGRTDAAHPVEISGDAAAAQELRALFARAQQ